MSPRKEMGKRGMQGTCVEQAEQGTQLKRLVTEQEGATHTFYCSQCPEGPFPWAGMQIQIKPPGRTRLWL